MNTQKRWKKYGHCLLLLYLPVFLLLFYLLEQYTAPSYTDVYCRFDEYIPFMEGFVIPYLLWFPFIIGGLILFTVLSVRIPDVKQDFMRLTFFLIVGLSVCLALYFLFPTCLNLRPSHYPRDNALTRLCGVIQGIDPPTNVCPSIHVYTTLVLLYCVFGSRGLLKAASGKVKNGHIWLRCGCLALGVLIVLSTLFIRQHSVVDVVFALILSLILYVPAGWFGRRFAIN